jgi:hypothetical protein
LELFLIGFFVQSQMLGALFQFNWMHAFEMGAKEE